MRLLWPALLVLATSCGTAPAAPPLPEVKGAFGARPQVIIPAGKPGRTTRVAELEPGGGRETAPGDVVLADVELRLWRGNQTRASTYGTHRPIAVVLDGRPIPRVWREAVVGRPAGSRLLLVGPAAQVLGPDLDLDAGDLPPGEPLVAVVDILGGYPPDARLVGRPLPSPPAGLTPDDPARTLIGGSGEAVRAGSKVVVQYVAVDWPSRTLADSSYRTGGPAAFTLTGDGAPAGWVEGLRGQRVGGRVAFGSPPEGLLYVVDVVDCVDC
ncbi:MULTISPECIES: FKBP-type peptidyl-prolyl cis-trans isomerase [Nonomuraea]|uniref:Peptidyl-prolyl cis-trans isomerase n=1 Tax=Nonomuraea ferruginea TaxID=46174 RepID=A0ABT4SUU1_9ACTN|nr:FKBP-type peptidyl-prolyl cis-trans isomerase [Nonomuraea ferruginea]MDA0640934.1 FKBP-type peptidyl-prolyl cis-trans isomerase [Nonomuraea ferruginea]